MRLNLRLLAIALTVVAVLGGGVHWLHGVQNQRHAAFFLAQAQRDKADGRAPEAVEGFRRYLRLVPDDTDARAELGMLLADRRQASEAFATMERVLQEQPDRKDVRRRLVDVALQVGRPSDAQEHLAVLLKDAPNDAELLELKGVCLYSTRKYPEAAQVFKEATASDPARLSAYRYLAGVLDGPLDRALEAEQCMDEAVAKNPQSAEAYCLRGMYLLGAKQAERGAADAAEALKIDGDNIEALLLSARCAIVLGHYDEARGFARRGIELEPDRPALWLSLADAERGLGNVEAWRSALEDGLKANPKDGQILYRLAELQLAEGNAEQAEEAIRQFADADGADALVEYLRACLAQSQGQWIAARNQFDAVRGKLAGLPELAKQAEYRLAQCCQYLGEPERQLAALRRAIAADRNYLPARIDAAELLARQGKLDEAMALLRETIEGKNVPGEALRLWAQLLLAQATTAQPGQRDFSRLRALLDRLPAESADSTPWVLLRARMLEVEEKSDEAAQRLAEACRKHPEQPELWLARIAIAFRRQDQQQVEQLLGEAVKECDDSAALRLVRLQVANGREPDKTAAHLKAAAADAASLAPAEQLSLWKSLAEIAAGAGELEQAAEWCAKIVEREPQDLKARLFELNIAERRKDHEAVAAVVQTIRQLDGEGPLWHYGEAVRLRMMAEKEKGSESQLVEALKHLDAARRQRPEWAQPVVVAAAIHEGRGDLDKAAEDYLAAVEMGVRVPAVCQRAVLVLYERQRYEDAFNLLRRLEAERPDAMSELGTVGSELRLRQNDLAGALAAARNAARESRRPEDHVWLGQMLATSAVAAQQAGRTEEAGALLQEAEASLRKGVELDRKQPASWLALVRFLALTGKADEAQGALSEAEQQLKGDEHLLGRAACYIAVGRLDDAEKCYRDAIAARPKDAVVLRTAGEFFRARGKTTDSEQTLKDMLALDNLAESDRLWARRMQAVAIQQRGGQANLLAALALVEENLLADSTSLQDQRLKAILLSSHPGRPERQQAARTLENLLRGQASAANADRLLLANVYESLGDWTSASRHLRILAAAQRPEPAALEALLRGLLDRGQLREMAGPLARLEELAPASPAAIRLRIEWLARNGQYDEAMARIQAFRDRPVEPSANAPSRDQETIALLESLGDSLHALEKTPQAEEFAGKIETLFRELVDKHPEEMLALAVWLTRQKRVGEALDLTEKSWQDAKLVRVQKTLMELQTATAQDGRQAGRLVEIAAAAADKHERPASLVVVEAEAAGAAEDYERAEKCYRELLAKQPTNVVVGNNLAVLLALQGKKLDEADRLANQAIESAGPNSSLLDTRAMVRLARGKPREALADLEIAIADARTTSRALHLAQAYDQLNDRANAGKALDELEKLVSTTAASSGSAKAEAALGEQAAVAAVLARLHPLERPVYRNLRAKYPRGAASGK